jgi:hypothetical protein
MNPEAQVSRDRESESADPTRFFTAQEVANRLEASQLNKFHTKGGTGFAAEDANALHDRLQGSTVDQVGRSNERNGTDRIADGVHIQTKYFDSASRTAADAFDSNGEYRYGNQRLEVPSDQHEEVLKIMRKKIADGHVPGVTDPADAESIVKRGEVTYRQARNIARPGTVDGLIFDAKTQAVTSGYIMGVAFLVNFARLTWSGKDIEEAAKESAWLAVRAGGTTFCIAVVAAQILRTRAAAVGAPLMRKSVKAVASTNVGKTVVAQVAEASLGKAATGAAAINHVSKLLRTNVITGLVTTAVVSAPDIYRAAFTNGISWAQVGKNVTVTGCGVAGGSGGWLAGAAIGTAICPIPVVGTWLGGFIGSLAVGYVSSAGSKALMDLIIEDDAKEMLKLLQEFMSEIASDHMLSPEEVAAFLEKARAFIDAKFLRAMYAAKHRREFVYQHFDPICQGLARKRPRVTAPAADQVNAMISQIEATIDVASNDATAAGGKAGSQDHPESWSRHASGAGHAIA